MSQSVVIAVVCVFTAPLVYRFFQIAFARFIGIVGAVRHIPPSVFDTSIRAAEQWRTVVGLTGALHWLAVGGYFVFKTQELQWAALAGSGALLLVIGVGFWVITTPWREYIANQEAVELLRQAHKLRSERQTEDESK